MNDWKTLPFFRLIIPFIVGIIVAHTTEISFQIWHLFLLFFLLVYLQASIRFRYRWVFGVSLSIFVLLFGFLYADLYPTSKKSHYYEQFLDESNLFLLELKEDLQEKPKSMKAITEVIQLNGQPCEGKLLLYLEKDFYDYGYGDFLWVQGTPKSIQSAANPNAFDYQKYCSLQDLYFQLYVSKDQLRLEEKATYSLVKHGIEYRKKLITILKTHVNTKTSLSIASALLLGFKDSLQWETKEAFISSGTMHILAVSGLHVGLVYLFFHTLLLFLDKKRLGRILKAYLLIGVLCGYALLTGLSPSVMRATTLFCFLIIAQSLNRKTNFYNSLAASAFCLLLYNPYLLFQLSFQFSYAAVLGIVFLQPRLYQIFSFRNFLVDKLWALSCVTISAQLATFPLALFYFHQFPNYFLLSNTLILPLVSIILPIGLSLFAIHWFPFIAEPLAFLLNSLLWLLLKLAQWIQYMPNALTEGIDISVIETISLYILLFFFALFIVRKRHMYFLFSLLFGVLLVGLDIFEQYHQIRQKELTFYSIKEHTAIAFIEGNQALVLMDIPLLKDLSKQKYHMHAHWGNRGLQNIQKTGLTDTVFFKSLFQQGGHYQFMDKRILLLCDSSQLLRSSFPVKIDYVLLTHTYTGSLSELLQSYSPKLLLLDGTIPYWKKKKMIEKCQVLSLPFYDLGQAAYTLSLP